MASMGVHGRRRSRTRRRRWKTCSSASSARTRRPGSRRRSAGDGDGVAVHVTRRLHGAVSRIARDATSTIACISTLDSSRDVIDRAPRAGWLFGHRRARRRRRVRAAQTCCGFELDAHLGDLGGRASTKSIRRRVLWITPLAILGVDRRHAAPEAVDEQDAIRQTTKFCLFATGLVVALTTIILACTNLPREIENRVIYTIVTKPTTRLEIVLGKVLGFARVSSAILLIMGVFTAAYLHVRGVEHAAATSRSGWRRGRGAGDAAVATLQHYRDAGLLNAKALSEPAALQIYARLPDASRHRRCMFGDGEGEHRSSRSTSTPRACSPPAAARAGGTGVLVVATLGYVQGATSPTADGARSRRPRPPPPTTTAPATEPDPYYGAVHHAARGARRRSWPARAGATRSSASTSLDANDESLGSAVPLGAGRQMLELLDAHGAARASARSIPPNVPARRRSGRVYIQVDRRSRRTTRVLRRPEPTPVPLQVLSRRQRGRRSPDDRRAAEPARPDRARAGRSSAARRDVRAAASRRSRRDRRRSPSTASAAPTSPRPTDERAVRAPRRHRAQRRRRRRPRPTRHRRSPSASATARPAQPSPTSRSQPESNRAGRSSPSRPTALSGGNFDVLAAHASPRATTSACSRDVARRSITATAAFALNLFKSLLILWLHDGPGHGGRDLLQHVPLLADRGRADAGDPARPLGRRAARRCAAPGIGDQVATDFGLQGPRQGRRPSAQSVETLVAGSSTFVADPAGHLAVTRRRRTSSAAWRSPPASCATRRR